jgi:thymidylate kinase
MEHILITGLDGSGKSTILNALDKLKRNNSFDVILLPRIDTENLEKHEKLQSAAAFVNTLSHESDLLQIPQLKAIAIFSSMLLFRPIAKYKSVPSITTLYCERHPLIDTGIYAGFYAAKMSEGKIDAEHVKRIDKVYQQEIRYIINLIPRNLVRKKKKSIAFLADFLLRWFYVEKKLDLENLKSLFHVRLPDKIFYLKASPEVLMHRLSGRKLVEAHETLEVLSTLSRAYDALFAFLSDKLPDMVEIVDAGNAIALSNFQHRLASVYK